VKKWEEKAYALLTFLRYPKEIRQFIYTTNQLERLAKEIKRRYGLKVEGMDVQVKGLCNSCRGEKDEA
jgi:Fe2+ or Zn2+ uptake regulation protein